MGFCIFDIGWRWWMVVGGIVPAFIVRLCYDSMKGCLEGAFRASCLQPRIYTFIHTERRGRGRVGYRTIHAVKQVAFPVTSGFGSGFGLSPGTRATAPRRPPRPNTRRTVAQPRLSGEASFVRLCPCSERTVVVGLVRKGSTPGGARDGIRLGSRKGKANSDIRIHTPIGTGASSRSSTARVKEQPLGAGPSFSAAYDIRLSAPRSPSSTSTQFTLSPSSSSTSSLSFPFLPSGPSGQAGHPSRSNTHRSRTALPLSGGACSTTASLLTAPARICEVVEVTASVIQAQRAGWRDWWTGRLWERVVRKVSGG